MATTGNLTTELAPWVPPGIANPISAMYAHAVIERDDCIRLAAGNPPLYARIWQDNTGFSFPPA